LLSRGAIRASRQRLCRFLPDLNRRARHKGDPKGVAAVLNHREESVLVLKKLAEFPINAAA
jgi:hypothetical protein